MVALLGVEIDIRAMTRLPNTCKKIKNEGCCILKGFVTLLFGNFVEVVNTRIMTRCEYESSGYEWAIDRRVEFK